MRDDQRDQPHAVIMRHELTNCFLSEMFLDKSGTEYVLCFRPVSGSKDSSGRHACQYLRIDVADARTAGQASILPWYCGETRP